MSVIGLYTYVNILVSVFKYIYYNISTKFVCSLLTYSGVDQKKYLKQRIERNLGTMRLVKMDNQTILLIVLP